MDRGIREESDLEVPSELVMEELLLSVVTLEEAEGEWFLIPLPRKPFQGLMTNSSILTRYASITLALKFVHNTI